MADQPPPSFSRYALSSLGLDRVRVGSGVVGHTTYVQIGVCVSVPALAWALSGSPLIALAGIAVLVGGALIHSVGTWIFAGRHPDLAAAGGREYRLLRELQMVAKGFSSVPECAFRSIVITDSVRT